MNADRLRQLIAAREGKPGFKANVEHLKAELAALTAQLDTSPEQGVASPSN